MPPKVKNVSNFRMRHVLSAPSMQHGLSFGIEAIIHTNLVGHLHQMCGPDFRSVNKFDQTSSVLLFLWHNAI